MNDDPMDETDCNGRNRCGAKTRSGALCLRRPAPGKTRCRLHGGACGSGGPSGERNGRYTHGDRTKAAIEERQWAKGLVRLLVEEAQEK